MACIHDIEAAHRLARIRVDDPALSTRARNKDGPAALAGPSHHVVVGNSAGKEKGSPLFQRAVDAFPHDCSPDAARA